MTRPPHESKQEEQQVTADALKAMAHPVRWRILCTLGKEELTVSEIVQRIGTTQSNISQHLDQLKAKNLLVSRKQANRMYYCIGSVEIVRLIEIMRKTLSAKNLKSSRRHQPVKRI